jgi:hypothetical protein
MYLSENDNLYIEIFLTPSYPQAFTAVSEDESQSATALARCVNRGAVYGAKRVKPTLAG